jgi:site-specific recombinase XerD
LAWYDLAGLDLELIRPIHLAAYMEKHPGEPLTKKQHLAAIRRFFSWYVVNGVLEMNPSRDVKLEKFSRDQGITRIGLIIWQLIQRRQYGDRQLA